jgi:hypothetical protein
MYESTQDDLHTLGELINPKHRHNGLMTKIWGGAAWTFEHCITFGYPVDPTPEQKQQYRTHFESLANVLPCKYCRDSYKQFISEGPTKLTDDVLANRDTLTDWFFDIHNKVNEKLEINYAVTRDEFRERFESFRARCGVPSGTTQPEKGCVSPLHYKAFSFSKLYFTDVPVITLKSAERFVKYAVERAIPMSCIKYIAMAHTFNGDIETLKTLKSWKTRNYICRKIIKRMRINGIPSIDSNGCLTDEELMLVMLLCSNLGVTELDHAYNSMSTVKNASS